MIVIKLSNIHFKSLFSQLQFGFGSADFKVQWHILFEGTSFNNNVTFGLRGAGNLRQQVEEKQCTSGDFRVLNFTSWVLTVLQDNTVSHTLPGRVVCATDSSFRQSPPGKSELTSASLHELHYLSSPASE